MDGMIQSYREEVYALPSNASPVSLTTDCIRTRSANCCGWLQHSEGSPLYKILSGGKYRVTFNTNVTSATAGTVAFGIFMDGVLLPGTTAIFEVPTAGDYYNISINKVIPICCRGDATITVQSVPTVTTGLPTTPATTTTEAPIIQSTNLTITRLS